jgi:spoIIIJ-associated protein
MATIEETIKKLLSFFEISEPEINVKEKENNFLVSVHIPDAGLLIGPAGESLVSLEQVLNSILIKKGINKRATLDINSYRLQKETYLRDLALKAAKQVMLTKKEIYLPPMNSYERRLIHLELAINPDIITESAGQEPERMIVIKPRT